MRGVKSPGLEGNFSSGFACKSRLSKELLSPQSMSAYMLSCDQLCGPMDCTLPGSLVHGLSQARILEWVAISFSRGSCRPRD